MQEVCVTLAKDSMGFPGNPNSGNGEYSAVHDSALGNTNAGADGGRGDAHPRGPTDCNQRIGKKWDGGVRQRQCDTTMKAPEEPISSSTTLGPVIEQSVYTAELAALAVAVSYPPVCLHRKNITILTSNQAVLLATGDPQQQSGQASLKQIYRAIHKLRERGITVQSQWVPGGRKLKVTDRAKTAAKMSTDLGKKPKEQSRQAKSTALHDMKRGIMTAKEELPSGVGRHSQEVDGALPGQHTKALYDALDRKEASTLAQLRTGMARLNSYLHRIGVSDKDQCECGRGKETVKHFLFLCPRWYHLRAPLLQQVGARIGDISFCLGGRSKNRALDPSPWKPVMKSVRAAVHYTMATKRLLAEQQSPY